MAQFVAEIKQAFAADDGFLASPTYLTNQGNHGTAQSNWDLLPSNSSDLNFPLANQLLIGIIDTGFSANNPDFDYIRILLGRDLLDDDDNPLLTDMDDDDHGTHVLGIIAATQANDFGIDGWNDDAPLWLGRAVGSGKWAESLVEFVNTTKTSGQPNGIVNLSFDLVQTNPDGSTTTRYVLTSEERLALEYARQHSILVVAAAGNEGGALSALGQAAQEFDNLLIVGSADGLERADYSNYGVGLGLLAIGGTENDPVLSSVGDGVGAMAGTSVATAKVTAAASQIWAANPQLNYRQVIEILSASAVDLGTPGWDAETGAGLLNLAAAINLARSTVPIPIEKPTGITPPPILSSSSNLLERPAGLLSKLGKIGKKLINGVKKVVKKAVKAVKTVANKIITVVKKVVNGVKKVAQFAWKGIKWFGRQLWYKALGIFQRVGRWVTQLPARVKRLILSLWEGVKNFKPWSLSWWKSLGKADTWLGFLKWIGRNILYLAEAIGVAEIYETIADFIKFNTRPLTNRELEVARSVFGNSINYNLVRVDDYAIIGPSFSGRAYTSFHTINAAKLKSDGTFDDGTLVHELTHVWQYEQDGAIYIPDAIHAQSTEGYEYGGLAGLQYRRSLGQGLTSFNREQQGAILEDYYNDRLKPTTPCTTLELYAHFVQEASTLSKAQLVGPGCALPDLVVNSLKITGSLSLSGNTLPLEMVVSNQGNSPANPFKVAVYQQTSAGNNIVPFTVTNTPDVGDFDNLYPFTRNPLVPGQTISFAGTLSFLNTLPVPGQSISLIAEADSTSGDQFIPVYGRVQESREDNNLLAVTAAIPGTLI
ncbi:MAG: S8 family serine peptidase [Oscillatoriales cyanobacterium C42_A2020_001]|nr:S8 family serine peptidase [Leptolyngbyaceae cyanobacterium C42_A2020_001]